MFDLERTDVHGATHVVAIRGNSKRRIIYLSTDAVFSGYKQRYFEHDLPGAINEYGQSKYMAEKAILEA
jgi:dTDP-4-dehydrorhamnose reductase